MLKVSQMLLKNLHLWQQFAGPVAPSAPRFRSGDRGVSEGGGPVSRRQLGARTNAAAQL